MIIINNEKTKALLFDFDGTLVLSEPIHYQNFKEVFKTVGIDLMSFEDFILHYSGKGGQFIVEYELEKFKVKADASKLIDLKKELFTKHIVENGVQLVAGAREFLLKGKECGYKVALVTGGFRSNFETIISHSDLPDVFDIVITNEDIKEPKPSPFCYLLAAEKLELEPQDCIVFEDALNGLESARNAGMSYIAVETSTPESAFRKFDAGIDVIKSFDEIDLV